MEKQTANECLDMQKGRRETRVEMPEKLSRGEDYCGEGGMSTQICRLAGLCAQTLTQSGLSHRQISANQSGGLSRKGRSLPPSSLLSVPQAYEHVVLNTMEAPIWSKTREPTILFLGFCRAHRIEDKAVSESAQCTLRSLASISCHQYLDKSHNISAHVTPSVSIGPK